MVFGASLWVLAGIAGVLIYSLSYLIAQTWGSAITIERTCGGRESDDLEVREGSKVPVAITIHNRSRWPLAWVLVEDLLPRDKTSPAQRESTSIRPPLELIGSRVGVFLLAPGAEQKLEYTIDCRRRGYIQVGPTVIETGDLLGLFRRFKVLGSPHYITVLPRVHALLGYDIGSRRPIGEIQVRENVMDDPTRLRGIRPWQIGDPMRRVHWAATARTGELHSKIYEPSSIIGATIIVDMHADSNPAHHEPMRLDLAISAAASIAASLHDAGQPFGLVTNGRDAADRIRFEGAEISEDVADATSRTEFRQRDEAKQSRSMASLSDRLRPVVMKPERTHVHYHEMVRTLARLERTDGLDLPALLVECESRISAETTQLVILQTAGAEAIAALIALSRRGRMVEVIINTYEPEDFARVAAPLTAAGIEVHQLRDDASISQVCQSMSIR